MAIICASLLVMKPLFASWIPAVVSEQPMSASEDRRVLRRLTGLAVLQGGFDDEEKAADRQTQARRDTAVAGLGRVPEGVEVAEVRMASRDSTSTLSTGSSNS